MTTAGFLALLAFVLLFSVTGFADTENQTAERQIKEPFYDFILDLAEGDSLGVWAGPALAERLSESGRSSRFPLELVVSVSRRCALPAEQDFLQGQTVQRIWEIKLSEDIDRAMPYSILGYHPGSLRVARHLVFSEWFLGNLSLESDGQISHLNDVRILRLDKGKIVLDADGLIDAILGSGLDDSWTLSLVLAYDDNTPIALAVGIGRNGRRLYGEMDLSKDEILGHGRPLAGTLSRTCRQWSQPADNKPLLEWQQD